MRRLLVVLLLALALYAVMQSVKDPGPAAEADAAAASTAYDEGDYARSAELYLGAAALAPDHPLALAWRAQGAVGLKMDDRPAEARPILLEVLAEAEAAGDDKTLGLALGNLARVEDMLGMGDEAVARMDRLARLAEGAGDPALAVKTLEQAGMAALEAGDLDGARARLAEALEAGAGLGDEASRRDALLRQLAAVAVEARDDEGAAALWRQAPSSAASLANQARHLARIGLHAQAAARAGEAGQLLAAQDVSRADDRDRVLRLEADQLLRSGQHEACRQVVDAVLGTGGDPLALAPFEVLSVRLALAQRDWDAALAACDGLDDRVEQLPDGETVTWLRAATLVYAGRFAEARAELVDGRPCAATALLNAWALNLERMADDRAFQAATEPLLPQLAPDPSQPLDRSLADLRELIPLPLPTLAQETLSLRLQRAARLRDADQLEAAADEVTAGVRAALLWQAAEQVDRVEPGAAPGSVHVARLEAWVSGRLEPDRAVLAVLVGETESYLVICTAELGATTIGLPPRYALLRALGAVVDGLRSADEAELIGAARDYWNRLFPETALQDLAGKTRWTLILPDELMAVPPAMWLPEDPQPGAPPPWLVFSHVVGLLPHALAGSPEPSRGTRWGTLGEPRVDLERLPLVGPALLARYGRSAVQVEANRSVPSEVRWLGEEATVGRLRAVADELDLVELAVPGVGGERLGGLLFSPMDEGGPGWTGFGDEAAGFLPWHRLAGMELPPSLVLPMTRFDPSLVDAGPAYAATAALRRADRVLLTRWPVARIPNELMLEMFHRVVVSPEPIGWAAALAAAQRVYLLNAYENGGGPAAHPRSWAAWMAFGEG